VGKVEAYTRRVIVTTSTSWRRRNSFHERPADALPDSVVADVADLIAADADLWTHLHALPSRQRAAVVVVRYCQDLPEVQTSELMGCSVGSVKRHASRGLAKLRDRMGAHFSVPSSDEPAVTS
jgi:DNA-directed RNA polymerase specialized sigma24 family protein